MSEKVNNNLVPKFKYTSISDQGLGSLWSNSNISSANATGNAIAKLSGSAYDSALEEFTNSLVNASKADSNAFSSTGIKDGISDLFSKGLTPSTSGNNTPFGMSSDTMSGLGSLFSIGKGLFDISNSRKQLGLARDAWKSENARAEEYLQMKRDEIAEFKADRARLNKGYANG